MPARLAPIGSCSGSRARLPTRPRPRSTRATAISAILLLFGVPLLAACGEAGRATHGDGPEGTEVGSRTAGALAPTAEASPARRHVLDLDPVRPAIRGLDSLLLAGAVARADSLPRLRCLVVARHGETGLEWCRDRYAPDEPANIKSVSKSVVSALVGVALEEGHLEAVDQPIWPFFAADLDSVPDPRKRRITIGHLLSMQSGLERTSGGNYGAWVQSADWVRDAIRRPMVAEPGDRMLYSTGNYHLLAAILTRVTGESLLAYARSRLGEPLDVTIPTWLADPQGIYFGGNEMRLSPRAMVRFGELYRREGRWDGRAVVPREWVRSSLEPRIRSPWSDELYGYGWFIGKAGRHPMFYAWGYGGQFIFVVPDLELTVAATSDPLVPRGGSHVDEVHDILDDWIVPAAEAGAAVAPTGG